MSSVKKAGVAVKKRFDFCVKTVYFMMIKVGFDREFLTGKQKRKVDGEIS